MKQLDLVILNRTGLHARPARALVDIAKQFSSTVRLHHGPKSANAKSLIAVLALGVTSGSPILIEVDGADEDQAALALHEAVSSGLGEPLPEPVAVEAAVGVATSVAVESVVAVAEPAIAAGAVVSVAEPELAAEEIPNPLRGLPGAPGLAIGPIFQFRREVLELDERSSGATHEGQRLQSALNEASGQLIALGEQVRLRASEEEAAIFAAHRELLLDPDLLDSVHARIDAGASAIHAWRETINEHAATMASLSDPLLAARASDLRDVGERVLRLLSGLDLKELQLPAEPVILIAYDLSPSETAALDPQRVLGFCTAVGGPNAHAAILARALGLPAVVGAGPAVLSLTNGTLAILDGAAGTLLTDPEEAFLTKAKAAQQHEQALRQAASAAASEPAITKDGQRVEVAANIGSLEEAQRAVLAGAEAVGLLRSEFLFLERATAPTEAEQCAVYSDILRAMGDRPVILRTLDIGGDKPLPYLNLPNEENPFLGERGIRLCQANPHLLNDQLRAALSASRHGKLRLMIPMVSDYSEIVDVRRQVEALRQELGSDQVEIGIMIEVPSAALMADIFANDVDFFSIGTNDLTQYTLAIDRTHPTLAGRADGLHPAVLRLISRTVEAAHAAGRWVGVCGELAADPVAVPILVGLGVDELSMSVPSIPAVKAQIRELRIEECRTRAKAALACATAADVRAGGAR